MTLTEATEYMFKVYLENGWLTPEQVKRIRYDSFIMAISIVLLPVAFGVLFYLAIS